LDLDIGKRRDPVDEIFRHRRFQAGPPHHEMQTLHLGRKVDDSLACGVAAAHERDLLAFAELGFDRGGPI